MTSRRGLAGRAGRGSVYSRSRSGPPVPRQIKHLGFKTNFYTPQERQSKDMQLSKGPDFSHCGQPVDWADQAEIDERFAEAITAALSALNVDIELVRWNPDDPIHAEYVTWWNIQARALRREIARRHHEGVKPTIRRRTDLDGITKCYLRFDRQRVKAVAA